MREREIKRLIQDARAEAHKRWCGDPPSCGQQAPCRASEMDEEEHSIIVRYALDATRTGSPKPRRWMTLST